MAAMDAAFLEIATVHRLMSRQERGTDVVALAAAGIGQVVEVDPRTADVLRLALALRGQSGGRFDPDRRGRADHAAHDATRGPAWSIEEPHAVRVLRRGDLDLDGIAKGYAVDRAIEVLESHGASGTVNAGGDLRCSGAGVEPLLVRSLLAPGLLLRVGSIGAGSFATSNSWLDARAAPALASAGIQDPRQRTRRIPRMTVSVAAGTCAVADALTKVVAVDPDAAAPLLTEYDASAWILEEWNGTPRVRLFGASTHVHVDAA